MNLSLSPVRYESAESAVFSDGSMEQDLPMQQLSEMFNVNHFIISQANRMYLLKLAFHFVHQFNQILTPHFQLMP